MPPPPVAKLHSLQSSASCVTDLTALKLSGIELLCAQMVKTVHFSRKKSLKFICLTNEELKKSCFLET